MKLWSSYLKRNLGWIAVILLTIFSMSVIVELNGVHISEWIYGTILCIFFLLVIGGVDFYLYYRRHQNLQRIQEIVKISVNALDMPKDQIEEDYQKLLQIVHEDKVKAVNDLESGKKRYGRVLHHVGASDQDTHRGNASAVAVGGHAKE